jgi:hypothetical protein
MRFGRVNRSRSSALRSVRYRVRASHQCARRVHAALCSSKAVLHRSSWLSTQQYLCRLIGAYLPTLQQQWTALPTLDAITWRMLVNDNSLVARYRIKELCAPKTLSALLLQREQFSVWYRKLVSLTVQELMSVMFVRS